MTWAIGKWAQSAYETQTVERLVTLKRKHLKSMSGRLVSADGKSIKRRCQVPARKLSRQRLATKPHDLSWITRTLQVVP